MKTKFLILISILFFNCSKDESKSLTNEKAINLVTGINLKSDIDDAPLRLGNPNVLVNGKFIMYPNPTPKMVNIFSKENISDMWIVPANPEKIYQDLNFNNVLSLNLYSEKIIIANSIISLNGQSSNLLQANAENLENGYYKVFVKIGEEIYWDNFYKCDVVDEMQISTIRNFWN